MARRRWSLVGWMILVPGVIVGCIPWWLQQVGGGAVRWTGSPGQWLGLWLGLNGVGLTAWCVWLFTVPGQGTPIPLDPPTRFVFSGPYRFVRNPMLLGIFLLLAGEAGVYRSWAILVYLGCGIVLSHLIVRFWEEPELERRFGSAYLAYTRKVPRWLPRPTSR